MFRKRKTAPTEPPVYVVESVVAKPGDAILLFIQHKVLTADVAEELKSRFPDNNVVVFGADWRAAVIPPATHIKSDKLARELAALLDSAQKRGIAP